MEFLNKILMVFGYANAFLWIMLCVYYFIEQIALKLATPANKKYQKISFRQWLAYVIVPKKRPKKTTTPRIKGGKR